MQHAALAKHIALGHDALEAVRVCPEHLPAWWRLVDRVVALPPDARVGFIELTRLLPAATPQAQWFRHSALWCLTTDVAQLRSMAALAPRLPDADRWMALAVVVWGHALASAQDRSAFRQLFLDTHQADLLGTLGRRLASPEAPLDVQPPDQAPPQAWQPPPRPRRVAIFASHLASGAHAGTAMVFNLRTLLEGEGVNTQVFAAQELSLPTMNGYFAGGDRSDVGAAEPGGWRVRTQEPATITLADVDFSISARWVQLLQAIHGYQPDLVLFVGFTSPLAWALAPRYPLLGMSLHTLAPLAPVDVWLAASARPGADAFWPNLPAPRPVHFPYRFWAAEQAGSPSRADIAVPTHAVLLVSTGHRLAAEMPSSWVDGLLAFLDSHPRVHWLLVGPSPAQCEALACRHVRVRCLAHQDDLAGWLGLCDIYLNPPRMGGGASVALAMAKGLAVLSLAGGDGGDKIGALAVADEEAYERQLSDWVTHPGRRRQAGRRLKQAFRDELDLTHPAAAARLVTACTQALECFAGRRGDGSARGQEQVLGHGLAQIPLPALAASESIG